MRSKDKRPIRKNIEKAIDRLVKEGRAERVVIDGKPGVRLKNRGLAGQHNKCSPNYGADDDEL